jgi:hypothetical protein
VNGDVEAALEGIRGIRSEASMLMAELHTRRSGSAALKAQARRHPAAAGAAIVLLAAALGYLVARTLRRRGTTERPAA